MPFICKYVPAPKDMSLAVYDDLPKWVTKIFVDVSGIVMAYGRSKNGELTNFYKCQFCRGYIEGQPNDFPVNTLNPGQLAGRQGTEYYCRRCGNQIGFFGIMS